MRVGLTYCCALLSVSTCVGLSVVESASCSRRAACLAIPAAVLSPHSCWAAEPEPAKECDDACQAARVARKQELLRSQDRRSKADAKVLFGGDFQSGKREVPSTATKRLPVVGDFLLPADVGGINLQSAGSLAPNQKQ